MFSKSEPVTIASNQKWKRHEIHLTEKDEMPIAVITFRLYDGDSLVKPVLAKKILLEKEAYDTWYENWDSEQAIYELLKEIKKQQVVGIFGNLEILEDATVPDEVPEIYATDLYA